MIYDHAVHTTANIALIQVATELVHVYIKQHRWHNSTPSYGIRHSKELAELVTPTYTKCLLTIRGYEKTDQSNINITFNKVLKETPVINAIECFWSIKNISIYWTRALITVFRYLHQSVHTPVCTMFIFKYKLI